MSKHRTPKHNTNQQEQTWNKFKKQTQNLINHRRSDHTERIIKTK